MIMTYKISIFEDGKIRDVFGPNHVDPDITTYDISDAEFEAIQADPDFGNWRWVDGSLRYEPQPKPPAFENKLEAERRLAATDWVNQPDVYDPSNTPHLLNRDAFIAYRSALRAIAINPTAGEIVWPTEPSSEWST